MFQLTVADPELGDDYSVILVKSTLQSYSVVCGLWPAMGGLTTDVGIGALKAYASVYTAPFQDCVKISVNVRSSLVEGFLYLFDGTHFVQQGEVRPPFVYGLCNGKQPPLTPLTCGMCQDITVAGVVAAPPVCVQSLQAKHTAYFPANNRFWLGVGKFLGLSEPQPGLLLSTSIIKVSQGHAKLGQPTCVLTLGSFASVDFSACKPRWTASYQPEIGSFQVAPEK
jgi:hypothetical protein